MNIKAELQAITDILTDKSVKSIHCNIPGRAVPYTRVIGRKSWQFSDQEKKYFEYINYLWAESQKSILRGLAGDLREARLEDKELFIFTKVYSYGASGGDTDNYGKSVADALQDRKKEQRLYHNDKAIQISITHRVTVDDREKEHLEYMLFWKDKEVKEKKKKGEKKVEVQPEVFLNIYHNPEHSNLRQDLYESMARPDEFGSHVTINPPGATKVFLDVCSHNWKVLESELLKALEVGGVITLPMEIKSWERTYSENQDCEEKMMEVRITW